MYNLYVNLDRERRETLQVNGVELWPPSRDEALPGEKRKELDRAMGAEGK